MKIPSLLRICLLLLLCLPASAETLAITGGRIHTVGPAGVIENGTIVIRDDRIVAVGAGVAVPPGARVVSAAQAWVTPGLFAPYSQLGLVEIEWLHATRDDAAATASVTAGFDVSPGVNPNSTLLPVARKEGVTRAAIFPTASKSIFAGLGALIYLAPGYGTVFAPRRFAYADLSDTGARLAGGARGAAWGQLQRSFDEAGDEKGKSVPLPVAPSDRDVVRAIRAGQIPLVVHVERASDILQLLEFRTRVPAARLILFGASEGWLVAAQIAAAKLPVIVDSFANLPGSFETLAATQENAARLAKAGVTVAIAPLSRVNAGAAHNVRLITQYAGNAVGHGLVWDEALKAITLTPARLFGVGDRLGSIEPGKIADLVIWTGDPLELSSSPTHVFIAGREMPLETRQTLLRDRYLDLSDRRFRYRP